MSAERDVGPDEPLIELDLARADAIPRFDDRHPRVRPTAGRAASSRAPRSTATTPTIPRLESLDSTVADSTANLDSTVLDGTALIQPPAIDPLPSLEDLPSLDDLPRAEFTADSSDLTADGWDLVRRTQEGDAEAFGLLYDRYVDLVYRFVYYRLGDRTQAEDLTSETFLRALRRISSVHEQGRDIGAWLMTIARNLVLDHVKSAQYRLCVPTDEIVDAQLEQAGDTTEAAALAGLDQRALLEAVRQLSPEQQESIVLRFFQGLSLAETAEVMGRNAGAVKALQHRAMHRLHALLSAPPPTTPPDLTPQRRRRTPSRGQSERGPPPAEDVTSVRNSYRTRNRRNH
jgi:RNA polymerase sigma-70 factor, ECF subfamily